MSTALYVLQPSTSDMQRVRFRLHTWKLISIELRGGRDILAAEPFQDQGFGPVDSDVVGRVTAAGVVDVGAADIGDFEDHVLAPLLGDEGYADVLHAVS